MKIFKEIKMNKLVFLTLRIIFGNGLIKINIGSSLFQVG